MVRYVMKAIIFLALLTCYDVVLVHAQDAELLPAHAHNDYEHAQPLTWALDHQFASVEVDIHLANGSLLVGHDPEDLVAGRTIESMYLEPLLQRVEANEGRVYPGVVEPLILLIDVKTDAEDTYRALQPVLQQFSSMLTNFSGESVEQGAVTAIISGNRARKIMEDESVRYAAMDGRLEDLDHPDVSPSLIPLISSNWNAITGMFGADRLSAAERNTLQTYILQAHQQGRQIRFWATPDNPTMWRLLQDAGVDLINTDDIPGLHDFLTSTDQP